MRHSIFFLSLVSLALASACGTRTSLSIDPPRTVDGGPDAGRDAGSDAGSDGGLDAGFDAGPPDGGVLVVDCGRRDRYTAPRLSIDLEASAEGPFEIVSAEWSLVSAAGEAGIAADGARIQLTPFVEGDFLLRFDAADAAGATGSCEVVVHSVVGPPIAICPEGELRTTAGVPIVVMGEAFDDVLVVAYQWELVGSPPGSAPVLVGTDMPNVELTADLRGEYVLRLTVLDEDEATGTCEVTVRVTGPPEVACPPDQSSPTRQPVSFVASAIDDVGVVSRRWELVTRPSTSTAAPSPLDRERTTITPDRQGEYVLRFTATDVEGLSASCEVTLTATPTPPVVTCPESVEIAPLMAGTITASAVDDGTIVSWRWRVDTRPAGSSALGPAPATAASTRFTPDIAGIYALTVTATDDDGMTGTCTTRVIAGNVDGLRVEMSWDTNGTDMDLHLLNREGTRWVNEDDCYYGNCNTNGSGTPVLDWYGPADEDDPRLDIDDTDGRGPENINIERPQPGTYRVAVHNYSGSGPNRTTVRIYCGGSTTEPRQTFGPVALRGNGGSSSGDFWRVADVTLTATGCTITDLTRADDGRPWIERHDSTIGMR